MLLFTDSEKLCSLIGLNTGERQAQCPSAYGVDAALRWRVADIPP